MVNLDIENLLLIDSYIFLGFFCHKNQFKIQSYVLNHHELNTPTHSWWLSYGFNQNITSSNEVDSALEAKEWSKWYDHALVFKGSSWFLTVFGSKNGNVLRFNKCLIVCMLAEIRNTISVSNLCFLGNAYCIPYNKGIRLWAKVSINRLHQPHLIPPIGITLQHKKI